MVRRFGLNTGGFKHQVADLGGFCGSGKLCCGESGELQHWQGLAGGIVGLAGRGKVGLIKEASMVEVGSNFLLLGSGKEDGMGKRQ